MRGVAAPLLHEHTEWLAAQIAHSPAANVYFAALLERTRTAQVAGPGGQLMGYFDAAGRPQSAYWIGASIVPLNATAQSNRVIAALLNDRGRTASSFVGPAESVLDLTSRLSWGRPRDVRADQPLLSAVEAPTTVPDPFVRQFSPFEADVVFPAAVAMFTEEVGYSPLSGGTGYRQRVESLIASGMSLGYTSRTGPDGTPLKHWPNVDSDEQVVFKADVGIVSSQAVQVQGVWVHPEFRGRGIAGRAMVSATRLIRRRFAPVVSLYANAHNVPALRAYRRAGFVQVGTFATVTY